MCNGTIKATKGCHKQLKKVIFFRIYLQLDPECNNQMLFVDETLFLLPFEYQAS